MNITVQIKNIYGADKVYPVCDTAKKLANLAGTKTFTRQAIEVIKSLGYTVNVKQATL